ncbi:MAG: DUF4198 domain-containing protein, partial [Armatimonadota bacterium]|nr:DUF4198 domain-containing protein [Armatimonadota bacterium]
ALGQSYHRKRDHTMKTRSLYWAMVVFVIALSTCPAGADEIEGRVLLPDGQPAVGAKIIARQMRRQWLHPHSLLVDEVTTKTDAQGYFRATVPKIILTAGPGRWTRPYVLIDAPGCALCFMRMTDVAKRKNQEPAPVPLQRAFTFQGTVVGPEKKPVASARVAIIYWSMSGFESSPLNIESQITTPQLIAKSGADGKFILRGITIAAPSILKDDTFFPSFGGLSAIATISEAIARNHSPPHRRQPS